MPVSVAICLTLPITSELKPVSDWRCARLVSRTRPLAATSPIALPNAVNAAAYPPNLAIPPSPAPPSSPPMFFFAIAVCRENLLTDDVALARLRSKPALSMPSITLKSAFTPMIHKLF